MGGPRLLDTNAYVGLKKGHPAVTRLFREASTIPFSVVVIAELLFGFRHGSRFERNHAVLGAFLADDRVKILPVTWATAARYGTIAAALRTAGTPIPTNDIWIAAQAFESGAELISFDAHFAVVPGLVWTQLR